MIYNTKWFQCDACGFYYAECEFAETLEKMLCQYCVSWIDLDGEEWEPARGEG